MTDNTLKHILECYQVVKSDIIRGCNTYLYDENGRKIVDFESGIWCTALGHTHPRINDVIVAQINNLMHVHYKLTSKIADLAAQNLLSLFPYSNGKAVFLSSGSEAMELAMRLSRIVHPEGKSLTFSTAYLSAISSPPRDNTNWIEIDYQNCKGCSQDNCDRNCKVLKNIPFKEISRFILESATCGIVLFPPSKLVRFLAQEIRENDGVIVANEVTTGLGRTGEWFGYNHYDVKPDIVALGKALGNGYPVSAVVMSEIISNIAQKKNFYYCQSHQNDPLACVIANEVINIFKDDHMIMRSKDNGKFLEACLNELKASQPLIKEIRGRGLMFAMELNVQNVVDRIFEEMLLSGYFIGAVPLKNVIRFSPSLTIEKADILGMCKTLESILTKI